MKFSQKLQKIYPKIKLMSKNVKIFQDPPSRIWIPKNVAASSDSR